MVDFSMLIFGLCGGFSNINTQFIPAPNKRSGKSGVNMCNFAASPLKQQSVCCQQLYVLEESTKSTKELMSTIDQILINYCGINGNIVDNMTWSSTNAKLC